MLVMLVNHDWSWRVSHSCSVRRSSSPGPEPSWHEPLSWWRPVQHTASCPGLCPRFLSRFIILACWNRFGKVIIADNTDH